MFGFPVRGTVCPHSYGVRLPMQPTARPDSQRLASATSNGASVQANVVLPAQSTVRPNALCVWLSGASYGSPPQPMFGFRYKLRRVGTVAAFNFRCSLRRAATLTMICGQFFLDAILQEYIFYPASAMETSALLVCDPPPPIILRKSSMDTSALLLDRAIDINPPSHDPLIVEAEVRRWH